MASATPVLRLRRENLSEGGVLEDEEQVDDLVLGWTLIDLSDPPVKRAAAISKKLGISIDDFIEQAIVEKVARWDAEQSEP